MASVTYKNSLLVPVEITEAEFRQAVVCYGRLNSRPVSIGGQVCDAGTLRLATFAGRKNLATQKLVGAYIFAIESSILPVNGWDSLPGIDVLAPEAEATESEAAEPDQQPESPVVSVVVDSPIGDAEADSDADPDGDDETDTVLDE